MAPLAAAAALLSGLGFAVAGLSAVRGISALIDLPPLGALPAAPAWRLSVVIAARDEVESLEAAVRGLLASGWPALELVVVNDRSVDGTGALLDRLASEDPRLRVVHVEALPEGWLGKVHAMSRGVAVATGDWILFTDADIHFTPDALPRALAYAEHHRLDHLTALPDIAGDGLLLDVLIVTFGQLLFGRVRAAEMADPSSPKAMGIGAFNLVRARYLRDPALLEWIRMEVADDMGLALGLKRRGARNGVVGMVDGARVQWYPSVPAMFRGLEKNLYGAATGYSPMRAAAGLVVGLALLLGPAVWLIGGAPPLAGVGLGLGLGCLVVGDGWVRARLGRAVWPAVLAPVGLSMVVGALAWSSFWCIRQGGVSWRGTFYSLTALKAGRRVLL